MRVRSELQLRFVNKHRDRSRRRYRRKRSTPITRRKGRTGEGEGEKERAHNRQARKRREIQNAALDALARARLRRCDTFDARLSNKLSTLWHSRRNRAPMYDRCREGTAGWPNGYAEYGEGYTNARHAERHKQRRPYTSCSPTLPCPYRTSSPLKGNPRYVSLFAHDIPVFIKRPMWLSKLTHLEVYTYT